MIVPIRAVAMYTPINPAIEIAVSVDIVSSPTRIFVTAFGWMRLVNAFAAIFIIVLILITFIPPPALPAQPPINISVNKSIWLNIGQTE